jgi:hypothetical protein
MKFAMNAFTGMNLPTLAATETMAHCGAFGVHLTLHRTAALTKVRMLQRGCWHLLTMSRLACCMSAIGRTHALQNASWTPVAFGAIKAPTSGSIFIAHISSTNWEEQNGKSFAEH